MGEERLVPKRRFEGHSKYWELKRIEDILEVNSGRDYKHLQEGTIPVYGTGGYMLSVNDKLSIKDGVGIGRKGTIDNPRYLRAPFWTVDTLFYMIPKENLNLYFFYSKSKKIKWKELDESTGVPSLSKVTINSVQVYIPSENEQKEIGEFFKVLDERIANQERKIAKVKALKAAYLTEMFPQEGETVPKRRFKDFRNEWRQSYLLDNIKKIIDFRGRTPKKIGLSWSEEGYLALSALNVKNGYIDYTVEPHYGDDELYYKWMFGNELKKGHVIFTTEAPMGNVAQVPDNTGYILSQRVIVFDCYEERISNDFLAVLLRSNNVNKKLTDLSSGGTAKGVSQKSLRSVEIKTPPLDEQQKIAEFFKNLDNQITTEESKLDKLQKMKQAYLEEMFV